MIQIKRELRAESKLHGVIIWWKWKSKACWEKSCELTTDHLWSHVTSCSLCKWTCPSVGQTDKFIKCLQTQLLTKLTFSGCFLSISWWSISLIDFVLQSSCLDQIREWNYTGCGVWQKVRKSRDAETRHHQPCRCCMSSLKLWLPWQQQEGGWVSACCAYKCHNASWVAISLSLPSIRQECVCERKTPSDISNTEDKWIKHVNTADGWMKHGRRFLFPARQIAEEQRHHIQKAADILL